MAETLLTVRPGPAERLRRYLRLTKPRVNTLIVFCAVIGMFLAAPGMVPLQALGRAGADGEERFGHWR
ncbi:MAG: hypothetical protein HND46_24240 [Chloroflexi bacterium]|nr:hypothetical protein [Chloroflexota bacterium]NOG66527.1 hypothetical protein [Chloroflexota bacterium]